MRFAVALLLLCACAPENHITATCEGAGCVFDPGGDGDGVLGMQTFAATSSQAPCTVADCPAGYNVIQGNAGNNSLNGTDGNDCILGFGGNDTIDGRQGNDYICGGDGNDKIKGGDGNDVIRGEAGQDELEGENQNDWLDGGAGNDELEGGDSDDRLEGGDGNDTIEGDNGNDVIDGGIGADTIDGGDGNDVVEGGAGNDTIAGANGTDNIDGGPGTDTVNGGEGTDTCLNSEVRSRCEITTGGAVCTAPPTGCLAAAGTQVLVEEPFTNGANAAIWPENIGWDGDFNGDWFTDGNTARPNNPAWGWCPTCPKPATTGFVKTINLCAGSGSKLSMVARVNAAQSSTQTRTTLVTYFLGAACQQLGVAASNPRFKNIETDLAFYDVAIPAGTTRIIVAPMAYLAADETNSVFYDNLTVTYEPSNKYSLVRTLASDDFSTSETNEFGAQQPVGWGEFGGDWLVYPGGDWATLWNAAWSDPSQTAATDSGITKDFDLGAWQTGDVVDLKAFAALTFTSANSHAQLRLIFNNAAGTTFESNRLTNSNWDDLVIRRAVIPAGATQVKVVVNAYMGAGENSSLYVDNLSLTLRRP